MSAKGLMSSGEVLAEDSRATRIGLSAAARKAASLLAGQIALVHLEAGRGPHVLPLGDSQWQRRQL